MPQLKCTVQTCVHNKQFLCDLDEITVGGESAKNPKENKKIKNLREECL